MRTALAALLALGATGCLSRHQAMREEYESTRGTEYLVAASSGAPGPRGAPVPALPGSDLPARLEAAARAIGDAPGAIESYDFEAPAAREVRSWAGDDGRVRESLGKDFDVDTLVVLAFARNPGVARALEEWRSVLARYEQAESFEDVLLAYNAFARELEIPFGPMMGRGTRSIAESIPPPGGGAKKGDVLDAEVAVARDEYHVAAADVVRDARLAFHDLAYYDVAIEIARANKGILSDLQNVVTVKYEAAQAEYADVLRAQAELDRVEQEVITLGTERERVAARIAGLLDLPGELDLGGAGALPEKPVERSLADLVESARRTNPDLAVLSAEITQMEAAIRLAEERTYYKYVQDRSLFDYRGGPFGAEESMEAPPAWYGPDDSFLQEMRLRLAAARRELEDRANDVRVEVETAYWEADAQWRVFRLQQTSLVEKARQGLEANRVGYQAARVSFLDVLDAERTLFEAQLAQAEARREYLKAQAELQRQLGKSL